MLGEDELCLQTTLWPHLPHVSVLRGLKTGLPGGRGGGINEEKCLLYWFYREVVICVHFNMCVCDNIWENLTKKTKKLEIYTS